MTTGDSTRVEQNVSEETAPTRKFFHVENGRALILLILAVLLTLGGTWLGDYASAELARLDDQWRETKIVTRMEAANCAALTFVAFGILYAGSCALFATMLSILRKGKWRKLVAFWMWAFWVFAAMDVAFGLSMAALDYLVLTKSYPFNY